jgi:CHAT domain-containing protein
MGNLVNGEGMLGLQRAFLNAGASAVVVSLWDVYDRSTTLMMQSFYKNLNDAPDSWADSWSRFMRWTGWDRSMPFGNTPSSMRRAKLAMLNSAEYNHPVYWAPFVVVGR